MLLRRFSATFLAGVLAILPLLITIGVVGFVVGKLSEWLGGESLLGRGLHSVAEAWGIPPSVGYSITVVVAIVLITCVGYLARRITGRRVGAFITSVVARVPLVNKVYTSAEQVIGLLARNDGQGAAPLGNVVLIRVANARCLGILSSPDPVQLPGGPHYMVFIPATPLPASGQNLLVPEADLEDIDLSVEEMTRIVLSLGSLAPQIMAGKGLATRDQG
ncbi:DUF502 domain-containing protein [bacterium]|nr:DUF502 domain-containing protein [bacterium]